MLAFVGKPVIVFVPVSPPAVKWVRIIKERSHRRVRIGKIDQIDAVLCKSVRHQLGGEFFFIGSVPGFGRLRFKISFEVILVSVFRQRCGGVVVIEIMHCFSVPILVCQRHKENVKPARELHPFHQAELVIILEFIPCRIINIAGRKSFNIRAVTMILIS